MAFRKGKKYTDLQTTFVPTYNHMYVHADRLNLSLDELAKLSQLIFEYNNTAALYVNPKTQDDVTIAKMADIYARVTAEYQKLRRQITNDARIELTPEDITTLGLKPRPEHYKHAQLPTYAPRNELIDNLSLSAKVLTFRLDSEGTRQTHIPAKRMKIERYLAITDSMTPPPMGGQYQSISPSPRSRFTLTFPREQHGRYAHLVTAYQNSIGKRGPYSAPLTIHIQS